MMTTYQKLETCRLLMKALAPHHMRIPPPPPTTTIMDSSRSSSTIQHAISRFCTHFSMFNSTSSSSSSPRTHQTSSHRFISSPYPYRTRCATLAHGQVSGCDVFVQFDPSVGQHVVFLQGPAREVLSRCSTIRHDHHEEGTSTLAKLDTSEIKNLEAMIQELEKKHQKVISFAEFLLEKNLHFSFEKQVFDFKNLNFPTKNLCYLGSIGIIEKIQPELVHLATKANETNVRLFITSHFCQYPFFLFDDKNKNKEKEKQQLVPVTITKFPILLQQEMNNKNITFSKKKIMIEACVYHSEALCISNTLNEWKQILMNFPLVIFDACTPNQMDLLVETLQEMGEKVALVASGSANAFALAKANLGFSIPTTIHSTTDCFVDLSQVGADIIMGIGSSSSSSPRCDAIQIVQLAKKQANPIPLQESSSPFGTINQGKLSINKTVIYEDFLSYLLILYHL
jgi:hypothetical protein